jgi:protein involved in polysaccharide export with SLBB domain
VTLRAGEPFFREFMALRLKIRAVSLARTVVLSGLFAATTTICSAQVDTAGARILHPGDHIRITLLGDDKTLSGEFEVAPDSTLKHPLYNKVKVVGVPLPQLRERFAAFLRNFQREPQFELEPLFKVTVGGEVRTPNILFLSPETTVTDAVALAGGATDRADLNRITLARDGQEIAIAQNGSRSNGNMLIRSGDQISVAARRNISGTALAILGAAVSVASLLVLAHR